MRVGVTAFTTDRSIRPDELARAVEERGFHSLYLPEHTHIPTSRLTPAPTGGDLAEMYWHTLDPWVALAMAGAVTKTIRLGTGVALVAQHDPIVLAKEVATLDHLTGGRVVMGIGFGWNREEMADHGVEYADRREVVRDKMLAMQALWAHDEAGYKGTYVTIEPSWSWPKPVHRRVPVLIGGGAGPKLFAHVAEYGDGWIPIGGAGLSRVLPELRDAWAQAGRDPGALEIVPFGTLPDEGKLAYYRELGVTEVVLQLPSADRDRVLHALDGHAELITRI